MTTAYERHEARQRRVWLIKYARCVVCDRKATEIDPEFPDGQTLPVFERSDPQNVLTGGYILCCDACWHDLLDLKHSPEQCRAYRLESDHLRAEARKETE